MRRASGSRKMWWICTRKRIKKAESRMDIEEILKMKLATISEEPPETPSAAEEDGGAMLLARQRSPSSPSSCMMKKGNKNNFIKFMKMRRVLMPQFSIKDSYLILMTGFVCKGGFHGLPRC